MTVKEGKVAMYKQIRGEHASKEFYRTPKRVQNMQTIDLCSHTLVRWCCGKKG